VKRARDPVKSRTVNNDVLEKYRTKLGKLEDDITRVLEEEKAEREIAKLENRAGKLQNRIDGSEEDRAWFQTKQQRKDEKQKLKQQKKDPTCTKRKLKKKASQAVDPETREANRIYDFTNREAKRSRQQKRIRVFNEEDENVGKAKKKKSKSSFESHIVNTSSKSVKAFRHVANKKQNDDKRLLKKSNKGKNKKSSFK